MVARLLGATLLGFYSVAYRITELPVLVIGSIVGRVMFPIYSILRDEVAIVRRAYLQNLQRVALLTLPVSVGMAVAGRPSCASSSATGGFRRSPRSRSWPSSRSSAR